MVSATRSGKTVAAAADVASAVVASPVVADEPRIEIQVEPSVNVKLADVLDAVRGTTTPLAVVPKTQKVTKPKQATVPRGIAKSGRPWKDVKQKFANIKKSIYRLPTEKKHAFREEMKHIKELSKSIKADKVLENENKRLRREQNAQRKQENERRSEVVQVIKNPAKIKRMKKKALRKIEKRDLSTVKTV